MKFFWPPFILIVFMLLGLTACSKQAGSTIPEEQTIQGPTLLMFYTDG